MKSSAIPTIRVEPQLREQLELVLQDGESVSAFVEASVRDSIRRRLDQRAFIERGMASLDAARQSGRYVTADAAVGRLQVRLDKARKAQVAGKTRAAK